MSDAMVTGRMTPAKKEAGNKVLSGLGINASQAINQLYDYLIEKKRMPFEEAHGRKYTREQIEEAVAYARSLHMPYASRELAGMSDDEVKRHKMKHRYGIDIPRA